MSIKPQPKGNNDECYTPDYVVEAILKYLEPFKNKIIWCPFDRADSEFVKVLLKYNFRVVYSHIKDGQDFYTYEPDEWDLIVSNPPFSRKRQIFERALSFGKPFALIMTIDWLNDSAPKILFKDKGLQLLLFEERIEFRNQQQKGISFASAFYCWNFLPEPIRIESLKENINQAKLKLE